MREAASLSKKLIVKKEGIHVKPVNTITKHYWLSSVSFLSVASGDGGVRSKVEL